MSITRCLIQYISINRCYFEASNLDSLLLIAPTSRLQRDAPIPLAALMEVHHWEAVEVMAVVEVVRSITQMIGLTPSLSISLPALPLRLMGSDEVPHLRANSTAILLRLRKHTSMDRFLLKVGTMADHLQQLKVDTMDRRRHHNLVTTLELRLRRMVTVVNIPITTMVDRYDDQRGSIGGSLGTVNSVTYIVITLAYAQSFIGAMLKLYDAVVRS